MRIDRAAEQLFVHPNTLRYRIGRFEEITGTNLRNPRTALEVWWALQRDAIRTRPTSS
jgi:DNA-binding PucR family transcriptional regulator